MDGPRSKLRLAGPDSILDDYQWGT